MLEEILPPGVAMAELSPVPVPAAPFPAAPFLVDQGRMAAESPVSSGHSSLIDGAGRAELAALGPVGPARAVEFAAGRDCARKALAALGVPPVPVLPAPDRSPIWPPGVVGSITHCAGYAAAVVGLSSEVTSIGVDAEPNRPLPGRVCERIAHPAELRWLRSAPRRGVHWDRLLFSAKESVYKAWAPLTGAWLGFLDATVTVEPDTGRFHAALHVPPPIVDGVPLRGFTGRFLALPDLVLTAIVMPRMGMR
jgi:4'-phosphopantetheinyl transferase EntD